MLEKFLRIFTNRRLAQRFYMDIRCGILHSTQTKNASQLTVNENYIVRFVNNGRGISVDVLGVPGVIVDYLGKYIYRLSGCRNED